MSSNRSRLHKYRWHTHDEFCGKLSLLMLRDANIFWHRHNQTAKRHKFAESFIFKRFFSFSIRRCLTSRNRKWQPKSHMAAPLQPAERRLIGINIKFPRSFTNLKFDFVRLFLSIFNFFWISHRREEKMKITRVSLLVDHVAIGTGHLRGCSFSSLFWLWKTFDFSHPRP